MVRGPRCGVDQGIGGCTMPEKIDIGGVFNLRKARRLSTPGNVLVKIGDMVQPDTIIARGRVRNPEVHEIRVDQKLGVDPFNVKIYLLKGEGDEVRRDEVIAIRRTFLGRSTRVCRSPVDGTIEAFSETSGKLLIRGAPLLVEVKSHVPGVVKEVIPSEGAVVECGASLINGAFGVGGETHGPLDVIVQSADEALTNGSIQKEHGGKVIVGGSVVTSEALKKAASVGVSAIIVGGVDEKDLTDFLGYEIDFGITGSERPGFTLILTEGFGVNPMNGDCFSLLKSFIGRLACVDGTTHIRARMLRPEIILPS